MKFHGEKIIKLNGHDIHLHYANNRGRGKNNVTLTIVKSGTQRAAYTRDYADHDIVYREQRSGWRGNVNIPNKMIIAYGDFHRENQIK